MLLSSSPPSAALSLLRRAALAAALLVASALTTLAQDFQGFVVFGDSLCDTGNHADRSADETGVRLPTIFFRYTDGRYTSGLDIQNAPKARQFRGVWHEQLAADFFEINPAVPSLEGGADYAFGNARTSAGTHQDIVSTVSPLANNGLYSVTVDDMGKQVTDFLSSAGGRADPGLLYILWGGNNDLTFNSTAAGVGAAVQNEAGLVRQLALAGARQFLVVNVPPLGDTPTIRALGPETAAGLNQLAAGFRQNLPLGLGQVRQGLAAAGINITITIVDSFDLLRRAEANPRAYGFTDVTGIGYNASFKDNADRFLFWDGFHPTSAGHYQIAAEAFSDLTGSPVVQVGVAADTVAKNAPVPTLYFTRGGDDVSSALTVNYTVLDGPRTSYAVVIPAGEHTVAVNGPAKRGGRGRTVRVALTSGNYTIGRVQFRDITVK